MNTSYIFSVTDLLLEALRLGNLPKALSQEVAELQGDTSSVTSPGQLISSFRTLSRSLSELNLEEGAEELQVQPQKRQADPTLAVTVQVGGR